MDGPTFKAWRESRNLTQPRAAELLGWTRDMLANRESRGVPFPDGIEAKLQDIDALLQSALPDAAKSLRPHGSRFLSLTGEPFGYVGRDQQSRGACYWEHGWPDPVTGAAQYQLIAVHRLTGKHHCTYIRMDTRQWKARVDFHSTPETEKVVDNLNARMAAIMPALLAIPHEPSNLSKGPTHEVVSAT